jgi:hypothetical protein
VVRSFPQAQVAWSVLATDGAQRTIDQLGIDWSHMARMDARELDDQLRELHRWEDQHDPQGMTMPRAKRHDDKALVTWLPGA